MNKVFLGLGGNVGNSLNTLQRACEMIRSISGIADFEVSNFYQTTPVSDILQSDFINAVCKFNTDLNPESLFAELTQIEKILGKIPKNKNVPRTIDIDILFFGELWIDTKNIKVPHSQWRERLFVLIPLLDLVSYVRVPISSSDIEEVDIKKMVDNFVNKNNERVILISEGLK